MMTIRQAVPADLHTVLEILHGAADWLHEQGYDQWPHGSPSLSPEQIGGQIERGETYLVSEDHDPVATIAVTSAGDTDFWTAGELAEPAVYVSKAAVVRRRAGTGIGALTLRWVIDHAAAHGARWARLDAWRTNTGLHAYYRHQGWDYLRTVELARRKSGALFQRPASPDPEARATLAWQDPPSVSHTDLMRLYYPDTWLPPGTRVIAVRPDGPVSATITEVIPPDYDSGEVETGRPYGTVRNPVSYVLARNNHTWTAIERRVWPDPTEVPHDPGAASSGLAERSSASRGGSMELSSNRVVHR